MKNEFTYNIKDLNKSDFLNGIKKDLIVSRVASFNNIVNESVSFINTLDNLDLKKLSTVRGCLIIVPNDSVLHSDILENNEIISVDNPRLMFAMIVEFIVKENFKERNYYSLKNNVIVGQNVELGENVVLEPFTFLDHGVRIGDNSIIKAGTRIRENVIIGDNCIIGENAVIGGEGFGLEKDILSGRTYRIPHIGGVYIGDFVQIGVGCSVVSGTIEPTTIMDNVFIDDLCHIAHNCQIGKNSIITACSQLSGSVRLKENCYVAPNATIRNKTTIGKNCFIGQAASITRNMEDDLIFAGNPGEPLENIKKWRKLQKKLIVENEE